VLTGEVRDGAALYGLISQLEALGLELIEITPLTAVPAGATRTAGDYAVGGPESGAFG
jgi:hypothetical protein